MQQIFHGRLKRLNAQLQEVIEKRCKLNEQRPWEAYMAELKYWKILYGWYVVSRDINPFYGQLC